MATKETTQRRVTEAQPVDEKSVSQHLRCNACSSPLYNAFQTPHGCRLCHLCVSKLSATDSTLCPGKTEACRDDEEEINIRQDSCIPDIATRREIGKLQVWCPNKDNGCKQQMKWKDVESHLAKCDFQLVPCEQCGDSVLKKKLDSHRKSECRQRRVACDLCGQQVVVSEMESSHKNLQSPSCCHSYKSWCPHCGDRSRKLNRSSFVQHLAECPEKPESCKFSHLGCEFAAKKSRLPDHYRSCVDSHLEMMDKRVRSVSSGAAVAAAARTPTTNAESQRSDAESKSSGELQDLQKKFDVMYEMFKKLQANAANWANTTIELQQMTQKFGGGFGDLKSLLKSLETSSRPSGRSDAESGSRAADTELQLVSQKLDAMDTKLSHMEAASYDGSTIWKLELSADDKKQSVGLVSPPFYSGRFGHKYQLRAFPNGTGEGKGSHLSVQLLLLPGEFDDTLEWPHVADVKLRLVNRKDRKQDVVKTATLDSKSQRPSVGSDSCEACSFEKFAPLQDVRHPGGKFLKDQALLISACVDSPKKNR